LFKGKENGRRKIRGKEGEMRGIGKWEKGRIGKRE
jgi:hypothetical protein